METLLIIITLASVATAVAALASIHRLRRSEQQRSEARVAALSAAAETHGAADGGWTQVAGEWQWTTAPVGTARPQGIGDQGLENSPARVAGLEPEVGSPRPAGAFFGTVQREEPSSGRMPLIAAAVLIAALGGALVFLRGSAPDRDTPTVAQASHAEPLELVALGHARDVRLLTITGTVRNPASGAKLEGLTAVVSLLDASGALVSTKDVPLDYRALGPGEEAPFKVTVPDPGSIARYRVSFRAGADVVPHVDRRTDTKLASALQ